ncbi:MAG TPA: SRPBCC family protein [Steroidobacteraceae bacterium]
MFKLIGLLCIVVIAGFLVYVALKPSDFRITRSESIKAAPGTVFAYINDLHGFNNWNPFAQGDPGLKIDYSGPPSGKGAAYVWDGAGKTGKGRMEITDSSPTSQVVMRLEFTKPMTATNKVEFTLVPTGPETTVTWSMTGRSPYLHKLMGTLFNMDKMVGGEFEKGLISLKALAEQQRAAGT